MISSENIWRERYFNLEKTMEYIFLGFADVLEQHENRSLQSIGPVLRIRKFHRIDSSSNAGGLIYCVADGENMEYRFTVLDGDKEVYGTSFTRVNSLDLRGVTDINFDRCRVDVKSHSSHGLLEASKELKL